MSSKSTADGWYFVSTGTGGIISVLRANLMVTFLLQEVDAIRFKEKERKRECESKWEKEHTQMHLIQI